MNHPVLGAVTISRSKRARRISLSVKADGAIRLSLPWTLPVHDGLRFLDEKTPWAVKTRQRLEQRNPPQTIGVPFSTRYHKLSLVPDQTGKISIRLGGGQIRVSYPASMEHTDDTVQSAIKKGIEEAWRVEAKLILPDRIESLSQRTGLKYRNVTVRNTVSKWGSCTSKNDISLSLHLMRLPDELIDYIILHELCHTAHHDHGAKFHALLDRVTGGRHDELRREIRKYHTRW